MPGIALIIDNHNDRQLLSDLLSSSIDAKIYKDYHREPSRIEKMPFDLAIFDPVSLKKFKDIIRKKRESEKPVFLPTLLLSTDENLKIDEHYSDLIDGVVRIPTNHLEILARIDNLLQRRRQSLSLQQQYRNLSERSPVGVIIVQDGLICYANSKFREMVEKSDPEIVGKKLTDFIFDEDKKKAFDYFSANNSEKFPDVFDARISTEKGYITGEFHVSRLDYKGSPAVMVIIIDITMRKNLERQFQQAQKMEAIGRLAGGIAHDFNNILTGIIINLNMATNELSQDHPAMEYIADIEIAAKKATDLVRKILAFSRKKENIPERVDLNQSVEEVRSVIGRTIGEDIEVETKPGTSLPPIWIERSNVTQIIMNIILNARDAMPRGGKISIETSLHKVSNQETKLFSFLKPGKYVSLKISDTGEGMDEETRSHIFEPFFTTKDEKKGTGLGLSMVYGLVKQAGGYIFVDSAPGEGTVFTILFPIYNEIIKGERPVEETHRATPVKPVKKSTDKNILVVDDDKIISKLLCKLLEKEGYKVTPASSGKEAKEKFNSMEENSQLVITDVKLPDTSGFEVIEDIKRQNPDVKVIYMSGYSNEEFDELKMTNLRSENFLPKPFQAKDLIEMVNRVLG